LATNRPPSAANCDLSVLHLDHFTVPVRDLNVARKFYCDILGGVVVREPSWERQQAGRALGAHVNVQLFAGEGHLVAYWQPWGQPAPEQFFPHRAFRVATAAQLDELIHRLEMHDVPSVLVLRETAVEGREVPASLYFRDPDRNALELRCEAYPFRAGAHVGPFDPTALVYPWSVWSEMVSDGGAPGRGTVAPAATDDAAGINTG